MRKVGSPEILEHDRLLAIRMLQQGLSVPQVAEVLEVDPQTVRLRGRLFERGGVDALRMRVHKGPKPKLEPEQFQEVLRWLKYHPQEHDLQGHIWTCAAVTELIRIRYGVQYTPAHVGKMMKDAGYFTQRPDRQARERDEAKITQ